jgi:Mrp family chromosome partitioning ATPase/capsular polysaccharide biosynthesis protein
MIHEKSNSNKVNDQPSGSGRKIDVLGALRRRWMSGIAAFVVVILLGTPIAWKKGNAVYRAEGVIYISPHNWRNLEADEEQEIQSNSQFREFMEQQAHTINRYDIVLPIVQGDAPGAKYFRAKAEDDRRATDRLRGSLEIAAVPDTYQMTVALKGSHAQGLAEVINAVMENYVTVARKEMFYDSDTRLKNLDEERSQLVDQIAEVSGERDKVAEKLGTTLFNGGVINNYEKVAGDNMSALMDARRQRLAAQSALGETGAAPDVEVGIEATAADQAGHDPTLASYRSALLARRGELIVRIQGLAEKHPGRIAAEKDIAAIDAELARATDAAQKLAESNLRNMQRGKLAQSADLENRLNNEATNIQARARDYMRNYQLAMGLGEELERLHKRLTATEDRISTLQLEVRAPGSVRIFSPAMTPQIPVSGGRKKLLMIVLAAALVLALALPVGIDFLDPSLRSAGELAAVIGLPVTGWLPRIDGDHGSAEEVLRLAVVLRRHLGELRSGALVITSLQHGSGSSTIALRVGSMLAKLGVRTLVVEVNPQTPDSRYIPCESSKGFAQWMSGDAELEDCICPATDSLPPRIGTGPAADEVTLMAQGSLRTLIESARAGYDLILVDAAPVTRSLLTEELIRELDAVMLVSQANVDTRKQVKQALEIIDRLHPRTFGSVINKVEIRQGMKRNDSSALRAA